MVKRLNAMQFLIVTVPVRNCSRKSREIPRIPKNISQEIPGFLRVNWHKIPGNSQEFLGKEMKNCSSDLGISDTNEIS